jgi:hypothetical protein
MSISDTNAKTSDLISSIADYSLLSNSKHDFVRLCVQISLKKMNEQNVNENDNSVNKSINECLITYMDLMRRSIQNNQ